MRRTTGWLVVLVATMVVTLAVLATLQYRWLGALSDADEQRMRGAITSSTRQVAEEVDHDINRIGANFQGVVADPEELARHAREWRSNARDARLVRELYLAQPADPEGGRVSLSRLDVDAGRLVLLSTWPADLVPVEALVSTPESEQQRKPPVVTSIPAYLMPVRPLPREDGPPPRPPFRFGPPPPRDAMFPPTVEEGGRPPQEAEGAGHARARRHRPPRPAILVARLDGGYITRTLVPDLAKRFLGSDYDVAVVKDPKSATGGETEASFLALKPAGDGGDPPWRLVVRRHGGALTDLVERTRRRNFAIGAAVLLLLAGSIVLLVILVRRAERFRWQQIEFVAGITHELNTPIAAVSSAGQNLADGIVRDPAQVSRYGAMITKEAKRLSDTVAQVLDFAGLQRRERAPRREPVDVAAMIGEAVAQCRWLAEEQGVVLDEQVPRDLPEVEGDPLALTRAVQNLIANAIRHGSEGKWVGVSASRDGTQVVIRVEDRGPGIAARDARHIFEPFFRGRHSGRTRGSGLGLAIVKQVALAHGGSIRLERSTRGAAFVLALPEVQNA